MGVKRLCDLLINKRSCDLFINVSFKYKIVRYQSIRSQFVVDGNLIYWIFSLLFWLFQCENLVRYNFYTFSNFKFFACMPFKLLGWLICYETCNNSSKATSFQGIGAFSVYQKGSRKLQYIHSFWEIVNEYQSFLVKV